MFAEQHVWHFWIAVPLAAGAVLFAVATIVGYLLKVVKPKYPSRGQQA
ncbi:MAG: hypothetical protein KDB04_07305 [Acidimicrobiales bacterium]|nr:hypothetical protein [Acidimicrobiales bacterium]HRW37067.1 hypothetical protein [Aquihabitans sp.]